MKWDMGPDSAEIFSSSKTYSIIAAPKAVRYEWSCADSVATIRTLGDDASAAVVTYKPRSSAERIDEFVISVTARNGCGITVLADTIAVKNGCVPITSVAVNSSVSSSSIKVGESVTYTATINTGAGTESLLYQWYLNDTPIHTGSTYTFAPDLNNMGSNVISVNVSNSCTSAGINSVPITLSVIYNPSIVVTRPLDMNDIHTIFMGQKTCLDVHKTGDNGTNSWRGDRLPLNVRPDDFLNGTYNFTYTFAGNGYNVNSLIYTYDDPSNVVSEVVGSGTSSATLRFKSDIVNRATGLTKSNPIKVTLYAIYTTNVGAIGTYKDSVEISVQDGACGCPAKIAPNTWKMDFCFAAGADYTLDPYIMRPEIYGYYYRWGRKEASASWSQVFSNAVSYSGDAVWDMVNENPCPRGWKVASETELIPLSTPSYNPQELIQSQNSDGYRGQTRGYVPISGGGYRLAGTNGGLMGAISTVYWEDKDDGHTWLSVSGATSSTAPNRHFGRTLYIDTGNSGTASKSLGMHVRCVSEGDSYSGN
jgi:hypothetical protein